MIADHQPSIRKLNLRKVIKAKAPKTTGKIRKFKSFRKPYFYAVEYFKLVDWTDLPITEPLVLKTIIDTELLQFIAMDVTPTIFFSKFFCLTQAVKKLVKLATEASKAVCGPKYRDGFIPAQIVSRQSMPRFGPKRNFTHFTL